MKSYIYIVITKELFRQSIVGQGRRGLGGVSLTSPAEPPGAGLLWDYSPLASCRGPQEPPLFVSVPALKQHPASRWPWSLRQGQHPASRWPWSL